MPLLVRIFKITMTLWFKRLKINSRFFSCLAVALPQTFLSPLLPDYIPVTCSTGCFCFVTVLWSAHAPERAAMTELSRFGYRAGSVSDGLTVCPTVMNLLRVEELLSLFWLTSCIPRCPVLAFRTTSLLACVPFSLFPSLSFPLALCQSLSAASAVLVW